MSLISIDEYVTKMTREEFDQYTEERDLCPEDFGLQLGCKRDECNECWDKALNGIQFKENQLTVFETRGLELLRALKESEKTYKELSTQRDGLKAELLKAMEQHGIEKWENEDFSISYIKGGTTSTVDSSKLKKEFPDIYDACSKLSNRKPSIRFKMK